jgi:phosphoribosylformylglycinamidine synthase
VARAYGTPFISGKDSLNNEYSYDQNGQRRTISIPNSLLITALGQVDDVAQCVTMDLKSPGNPIYIVGLTRQELGGSHVAMIEGLTGGNVPEVDTDSARKLFATLHKAIKAGHVRACHDLSEGGLAVAVAEMAFAGGLGATIRLEEVPSEVHGRHPPADQAAVLLFSESHSRFLCEVPRSRQLAFERAMAGVPHANIGNVTDAGRLQVAGPTVSVEVAELLIDLGIDELKDAWQKPLRW